MDKRCSVCKETKDTSNFYTHKIIRDGFRPECKVCTLSRNMKYRNSDIGKKKSKESSYKHILHKIYRMSNDDFNSMLVKQDYKCKICSSTRKLVVDHCHLTNKVRGLLCYKCNTGLGLFNDNPDLISKALLYIKES